MLRLFTKKTKYEIEFSEDLLAISEFRALIDADKSKNKVQAEKELKYIYFVYDFNSYLATLEEPVRKTQAIKECKLPDDYKPTKLHAEAINKYLDIQENSVPTLKLLRDAYTNLDSIGTYIKNINYHEKDKLGRPVNSPDTSMNTLTKVGKVHESIKILEEKVLKEIAGETTIRGGGKIGEFEDGV
jgi:hypothetical protein